MPKPGKQKLEVINQEDLVNYLNKLLPLLLDYCYHKKPSDCDITLPVANSYCPVSVFSTQMYGGAGLNRAKTLLNEMIDRVVVPMTAANVAPPLKETTHSSAMFATTRAQQNSTKSVLLPELSSQERKTCAFSA